MQIKIEYKDNGIAVYDHDLGVYTDGKGESYCTFNKLTVIPQNELPIQLVY